MVDAVVFAVRLLLSVAILYLVAVFVLQGGVREQEAMRRCAEVLGCLTAVGLGIGALGFVWGG